MFSPWSRISSIIDEMIMSLLSGKDNHLDWEEKAGIRFEESRSRRLLRFVLVASCSSYPEGGRYFKLCQHVLENPGLWSKVAKCHQMRTKEARLVNAFATLGN